MAEANKAVAPVGQLLVIAGVVNAGWEGLDSCPHASCHEKVVSCSLSHDDDDFNHGHCSSLDSLFTIACIIIIQRWFDCDGYGLDVAIIVYNVPASIAVFDLTRHEYYTELSKGLRRRSKKEVVDFSLLYL